MSNAFVDFMTRLFREEDAAAQERLVRFARQLIALVGRHIGVGLRHKMDPEDVVHLRHGFSNRLERMQRESP
jgi:hypothetical protein